MTHFVRDAAHVEIEGVPTLGWGRGRECTFLGALEAALAVTDTPIDYEELMGISALAFRVRWYQGSVGPRWCPSCAVGEFPQEIESLRAATGWDLNTIARMDEPSRDMTPYAGHIATSIDAGLPVLAYDEQYNMGVIYGYRNDGRTLLFREYMKGDQPSEIAIDRLGPMLVFLGERHEALPPHEALVGALHIAEMNWRHAPMLSHNERGRYLMGIAALQKWIEDLENADELNGPDRENLFFVNWWNFDALADARAAAVTFLERRAATFEGAGRDKLRRVADIYHGEVGELHATLHTGDAFLGPWTGKTVADWCFDTIRRECVVLGDVIAAETQAMNEIDHVIQDASLGIDLTRHDAP